MPKDCNDVNGVMRVHRKAAQVVAEVMAMAVPVLL